MIYKFKDKYYLNIVFHKKSSNLLTYLYKLIFRSKFCHISIILDGIHQLNCDFDGIFIKTLNKKKIYEYDYRYKNSILLKINEEQYYNILKVFNKLNNKKYSFLSLFKNLNKNYNIISKDKYICTEILELILYELNIDLKHRYNVENFYNNLKIELNNKNIEYLEINGE